MMGNPMDWSKIATVASVLSLPGSIVLYIGWAVIYGPKFMSKQMLVVTILFLCFFTILAVTTISVFQIARTRLSTTTITSAQRAEQQVDLSKVLYVGRITVDAQHLQKDYYLRLTITGFNGTGTAVTIGGLDGSIRYREVVNYQAIDRGMLPMPSIDTKASYNLTPTPYSEFWVVLEQRLPSALAARMSNSLSANGTIQLDLSSFDIWVAQQDAPQKRRRLPIWDGISCRERSGMIFVDKVINTFAADTLGTKASIQ
jgi:hypothetical protein